MAKLTESKIGKLKWDKSKPTSSGRQIHNDEAVGGLHLRVLAPKDNGNSSKVFYVAYGPSHSRKLYRIGAWGEWTLNEAREKARAVRKAYYEDGEDPNQIKKQKIQSQRKRLTVRELVAQFLAEKRPVWSASYNKNNRRHGNVLIANVGGSLAEDITLEQGKRMFLKFVKDGKGPTAELFRVFGTGLYNWAMDHEKVPQMRNPFVLEKSRGQSSQFRIKQNVRGRVLEYKKEEATQLFNMLEAKHIVKGRNYLTIAKLYLLTGFRNKELRTLRWEDVDTAEMTIHNNSPKAPNIHEIKSYKTYLCPMAYKLLVQLGDGNIKFRKGPVFPSRKKNSWGGYPTKHATAWHRWDGAIKQDPLMPECPKEGYIHIHDLRRTATTWLQINGVSTDNISIFKGSKPRGVTQQAYMHGEEEVRKDCVEIIEKLLHIISMDEEKNMFMLLKRQETANG